MSKGHPPEWRVPFPHWPPQRSCRYTRRGGLPLRGDGRAVRVADVAAPADARVVTGIGEPVGGAVEATRLRRHEPVVSHDEVGALLGAVERVRAAAHQVVLDRPPIV